MSDFAKGLLEAAGEASDHMRGEETGVIVHELSEVMTPLTPDMQHEAGDRAFVAGQHFSDFVKDHRFVQAYPDLAALAQSIEDDMAELYQAIWRAETSD